MSRSNTAVQRLSQQRLTANPFSSAREIVSWLGAVQSQDYAGAKWSLGMRMENASDAAIERAFNEGAILRTHIMRPTWHFVTPTDIRWIQSLTAAQVIKKNAYYSSRAGLDEALLRRCTDVIAKVLEGGQQLTRTELSEALARTGISAEGQQLGHIVMHAEVSCVICSGPRRGKQFTYMLLSERAPEAKPLPRDEALAELTRRYFTGHGPATARDFAWWSGLSMADVKAGLDTVAPTLDSETIEGQAYYYSADLPPEEGSLSASAAAANTGAAPTAFLLPTYDEYHVGYANFGQAILFGREGRSTPGFDATLLFDGRVIGFWRRALQKERVTVELLPLTAFTSVEKEAIGAAADRYGKFLGLPVDCAFVKEGR